MPRSLAALLAACLVFVAPLRSQSTSSDAHPFDEFIAEVRSEALMRGISPATLDAALSGLAPDPVSIVRDRAQPEHVQSLDAYVAQRVSPRTIATARAMRATHRDLLGQVHDTYGISPALMMSIWGLESNFGRFTGTYPTVRALVTLAYDGRRPLFRTELFNALTILDRGLVAPADLKGSWAGAMGQPQFLPSSFLSRAVDFDGDGDLDIWSSVPDVLGSMANYLKHAGWTGDERWGREVRVSASAMAAIDKEVPLRASGCRAIREMTESRPLDAWRKLGVTLETGAALPVSSLSASLVRGRRRHFLVYRNYEAILDYNCSNSYAVAVGVLADRIESK